MSTSALQRDCLRHERVLLAGLVGLGVLLRAALFIGSSAPFGYVYDFYPAAVAFVYDHHSLPPASACWICAHPPLFWIVGAPFYALGMAISHQDRATAERVLCLVPLLCDALVVFFTYRLLRLYRQRGASLLCGMGLCLLFPCLVISSHAPESDILLTALMVGGLFHLARLHVRARHGGWPDAWWLGLLSGLAALTKYSGLLLLAAAGVVLLSRLRTHPRRLRTLRQAALVCSLALSVGGAQYVYNYRVHHEWLVANGSAQAGFDVLGLGERARNYRRYDFASLRLPEALELFEPRHATGTLTDQPVYLSVWTTLHTMAWTDMTMFSVHARHGDPSQPYRAKHVPVVLVVGVLYLGLLPTILAGIGFALSWRRRSLWPLSWFAASSWAAYVWWFIAQDDWALKTKYVLFLLPVYVLFASLGCGRVLAARTRPGQLVARGTVALLGALLCSCAAYLGCFALG
jgi:4-amino-4-deoxy-L-arabinose transferase-like glycosyltransferase